MKHTGSTFVILLFLGLSYFIFPRHPETLPQKAAADTTQKKILAKSTKPQVVTTLTPTPFPTIIVTPTPTSQVTPSVIQSDIPTYLLQQVNIYRKSQDIGEVATNKTVCDFAVTRAQEITTNFSHDGFTQRIAQKTLPYPTYTKITENIAEDSRYQDVIVMWINSPSHAANMRADTPYVCIAYSGNYYAYEGWKP